MDRKQFEFLTSKVRKAGLSWSTVCKAPRTIARRLRVYPEKVARF